MVSRVKPAVQIVWQNRFVVVVVFGVSFAAAVRQLGNLTFPHENYLPPHDHIFPSETAFDMVVVGCSLFAKMKRNENKKSIISHKMV